MGCCCAKEAVVVETAEDPEVSEARDDDVTIPASGSTPAPAPAPVPTPAPKPAKVPASAKRREKQAKKKEKINKDTNEIQSGHENS